MLDIISASTRWFWITFCGSVRSPVYCDGEGVEKWYCRKAWWCSKPRSIGDFAVTPSFVQGKMLSVALFVSGILRGFTLILETQLTSTYWTRKVAIIHLLRWCSLLRLKPKPDSGKRMVTGTWTIPGVRSPAVRVNWGNHFFYPCYPTIKQSNEIRFSC